MYLNINIFDFDGTLFNSPLDTQENRDIFEKYTGQPWNLNNSKARELSQKLGKHVSPRRGWWGRPETLEHPILPHPIPDNFWISETVNDLKKSINADDTLTIIMTGRHQGIKNQVLKILHSANLFDIIEAGGKFFNQDHRVHCLFYNEDGPSIKSRKKPSSGTLPWKLWIIEKYLDLFPECEKLTIWEDREHHVKEFMSLNELITQEVVVRHVAGE